MRYLPLLILMASCSPQAVNDLVVGEEKVIETLIQDESGIPIGTSQPAQKAARPSVVVR
jgi:hypothetical protein